jgi:hypothetical protein
MMRIRGENLNAKKLIDRARGQYRCEQGVMRMDDVPSTGGNLTVRAGMNMRQVYRTERWLYVKSTGMETTMVLVIPFHEYEYRWARFPVQAITDKPSVAENAP